MLSSSVWRGASRWWFSTGLLIGGVLTTGLACLLAMIGLRWWAPSWLLTGLVLAVLVAALAYEARILRCRLPQNGRQVPEHIEGAGPRFGPLQFGVEMGTGLRTFMTSPVPHLALVTVIAWASLPEAVAAGLGFGLGRALMTSSRHLAPDRQRWDAALSQSERGIRFVMLVVAAASVAAIYLFG